MLLSNNMAVYSVLLIFLSFVIFAKTDFNGSDMGNYIDAANNLLNYGVFSSYLDPQTPDNLRTIGLPLVTIFSKLISERYFLEVVIFLQIFAMFGTIFYFIKILSLFNFDKKYTLFLLPFFIHPEFLNITTSYQTECFNTFFLILFFYFAIIFFRQRDFKSIFLAILYLSIAIHFRPTYLYFVPIFLIFISFSSGSKKTIFAIFIFVLLIGFWMIRNKIVLDVYSFSSVQGYNLAYFRAADLIRKKEGISHDDAVLKIQNEISQKYNIPISELGLFATKDKKIVFEVLPNEAKKIILENIEYLPLSIMNGLARQFLLPHNIYSIKPEISIPINEYILALKAKDFQRLKESINIYFLYLYIFPYFLHLALLVGVLLVCKKLIFDKEFRTKESIFIFLFVSYGAIIVSGAEANTRFIFGYYFPMILALVLVVLKREKEVV